MTGGNKMLFEEYDRSLFNDLKSTLETLNIEAAPSTRPIHIESINKLLDIYIRTQGRIIVLEVKPRRIRRLSKTFRAHVTAKAVLVSNPRAKYKSISFTEMDQLIFGSLIPGEKYSIVLSEK